MPKSIIITQKNFNLSHASETYGVQMILPEGVPTHNILSQEGFRNPNIKSYYELPDSPPLPQTEEDVPAYLDWVETCLSKIFQKLENSVNDYTIHIDLGLCFECFPGNQSIIQTLFPLVDNVYICAHSASSYLVSEYIVNYMLVPHVEINTYIANNASSIIQTLVDNSSMFETEIQTSQQIGATFRPYLDSVTSGANNVTMIEFSDLYNLTPIENDPGYPDLISLTI